MSEEPKKRHVLVSSFSDASFEAGLAGFAFWYRSGGFKGRGSDCTYAKSVNHAELLGIIAGAEHVYKTFDDGDPLTLLIQCDSMAALGAILTLNKGIVASTSPLPIPKRKRLDDEETFLIETFFQNLRGPVYLKHIKGHSGIDDPRSKVNNWTDKQAYRELRKMRESLIEVPS